MIASTPRIYSALNKVVTMLN